MAFQSKSEQRAALSKNYSGSVGTLQSTSVKGPSDMGNNGPKLLMGRMGTKGDVGKKLYGSFVKSTSSSGISGPMSGSGFPGGARQSRVTEPGNLKPGTAAQAKNTIRVNPDTSDQGSRLKLTGSTPKALRGGK